MCVYTSHISYVDRIIQYLWDDVGGSDFIGATAEAGCGGCGGCWAWGSFGSAEEQIVRPRWRQVALVYHPILHKPASQPSRLCALQSHWHSDTGVHHHLSAGMGSYAVPTWLGQFWAGEWRCRRWRAGSSNNLDMCAHAGSGRRYGRRWSSLPCSVRRLTPFIHLVLLNSMPSYS